MSYSVNPFLPSWEYIPDGEPRVFGDRLYLFGSHDRFNGTQFCMNNYVCWSAPVDDLADWKFHGTMYRKNQDPAIEPDGIMQAPDVIRGTDGRYYLYYALGMNPCVSVAVSEKPEGPYQYLGVVHYADGTPLGLRPYDVFAFDPGAFLDDDGRCWLYVGFGPEETGMFAEFCKQFRMDGAYVMELEPDMITIKTGPRRMLPKAGIAEGAGFEGHEFYEASSMRKINGTYYFVYSSILSHELCYAVSDKPDRDFTYGGTIVSIGDIGYQGNTIPTNYLGNTHGGMVEVNGQWYIFYHRQTNRHNYSRQACAEKISILVDGSIPQTEITSCGLSARSLPGNGVYPAHTACNLWAKEGALIYGTAETPEAADHPYFTQTGDDRENNPDQYIANMQDGATAGFKYFQFEELHSIGITVRGEAEGWMEVRTKLTEEPVCTIPISAKGQTGTCEAAARIAPGVHGLYFTYTGTGALDFLSFELK